MSVEGTKSDKVEENHTVLPFLKDIRKVHPIRLRYLQRLTSMASPVKDPEHFMAYPDVDSFIVHLKKSTRILALLGAGLSASSGLPTFRGAGGLWRNYDAMSLATPEAFEEDPALVWQFYSHRRHMALKAQPNAGHHALAALARRKPHFMTLTQNVDGLSPRANHPESQIHFLHGSLFDVKCTSFYCNYSATNYDDPIVPALAEPEDGGLKPTYPVPETTTTDSSDTWGGQPSADKDKPATEIPISALPHCPSCKTGLLRPGVVWFGEPLPAGVLDEIDQWLSEPAKVDLMMVIGTSSKVHPAAGYTELARQKGARVAVVNLEKGDTPSGGLAPEDWFFEGDAAGVLPTIFAPVLEDE